QNCRSHDIRVMQIPRDQPAQVRRILTRSAAAGLMHQKLDAIHVLEERGLGHRARWFLRTSMLDLIEPPLLVEFNHVRYLAAVHLRRSKPQFLLERLLQRLNVPVFAKHQRDDQPVIARAYLSVGSLVAEKSPLLPQRNIWSMPALLLGLLVE